MASIGRLDQTVRERGRRAIRVARTIRSFWFDVSRATLAGAGSRRFGIAGVRYVEPRLDTVQ
jgi:hypothetical protein